MRQPCSCPTLISSLSKYSPYPGQWTSLPISIMSAIYDLYDSPNPDSASTDLPVLHARIVNGGTTSSDKIVNEISDAATFTPGDVKGVLSALAETMVRHLSMGNSVELEGLGFFSISLKCKGSSDRKEINSSKVRFGNIHFRASKQLKEKLYGMRLFRRTKVPVAPTLSMDTKYELVEKFLTGHPFLTRADYQNLVSCDKSKAVRDLNFWLSANKLLRYGSGTNFVYILSL